MNLSLCDVFIVCCLSGHHALIHLCRLPVSSSVRSSVPVVRAWICQCDVLICALSIQACTEHDSEYMFVRNCNRNRFRIRIRVIVFVYSFVILVRYLFILL